MRLRETEASLTSTIREKEYQLERLKLEIFAPTVYENWIADANWNENSWAFPLDAVDDFQYSRATTYVPRQAHWEGYHTQEELTFF
jgi:hypothetical protein